MTSPQSPFYDVFAKGVRDAEQAVPASVVQSEANPSKKRFNVYRNNHYASLIEALNQQFPATRRAAGGLLFRNLARAYAHARPPTSPVMLFYGESFADFIKSLFVEDEHSADDLLLLSELANLDYACRLAYHAEDQTSMCFDEVLALTPEQQVTLQIRIHMAANWRVHRSKALASLWLALMEEPHVEDEPSILLHNSDFDRGEVALITRPDLDVLMTPLPLGSELVLEALKRGLPLGEALASTDDMANEFAVSEFLAKTFTVGAFHRP